ncbi:MAG TPA: beta-ketoacyl-ACP synthase III [Dehalococcoidia bacterium]
MPARISGVGKYLPQRVLSNADLEKLVDTNDQWIVERTGIRERRIAADNESSGTMGAEAARMALRTAGLQGDDLDLVVCATCTPDGMFPGSSAVIQDAIGATKAGAFDVSAACTGFLSAFTVGAQFIDSGACNRVLVVGSEVYSRILNWSDRSTCILFGDGAGAVVLERGEEGAGGFVLKSDGAAAHLLYARGPASAPAAMMESEGYYVKMECREVFKYAVRAMEDTTRESLARVGLGVDDITWVVPPQANQRILSAYARALGLPEERVVSNLASYGNTSSATIPIAMCEAWEDGRLKPGDNVVLTAIGGGLTWGACTVRWTGLGSE